MAKTFTFMHPVTREVVETTHPRIEDHAAEERSKKRKAGEQPPPWLHYAGDFHKVKEYDPDEHDETPEDRAARKKGKS